ncbi:MAG: PEGA domain-containing protein [Gallionellaceae bacterium]|nr:PEGA domain-containing protein [Gallionellaceae bacterium]
MDESGNKTIMCSVLFLDISEYSKKQVAEQIILKEAFNSFLAKAIRDIPINDRIILDTGDGAAISFLGDVSDALKVALSLRESFFQEGVLMTPPLLVCAGINLGPVRLVRDINGQPNIVGDGINVAQRIMGFADAGQVLVSRSYYDAVSRLSKEYAGMFHYQGLRTDKHVREHEVYAIGYPGELAGSRVRAAGGPWQSVRNVFQNASAAQRALYVGLPVVVFVLLVAALSKVLHRPAPALPKAAEVMSQPVSAPVVSGEMESLPKRGEPAIVASTVEAEAEKKAAAVARKKVEAAPAMPEHVASTAEKPQKTASLQQEAIKLMPASAVPESTRKTAPLATVRTLEETMAAEPRSAAIVSLAITPWGEIYLDGRMQGVSPPLTELHVAPGKHEIEIRNTTFPAYVEKVQLKANEKVKIKYKFTN